MTEDKYYVIIKWGSEISFHEFETKEKAIEHAQEVGSVSTNITFIKGKKVKLTLIEEE